MQVIRPVHARPATPVRVAGPVFVTGAARGIGLEVALLCATNDIPVALLDRDEHVEHAANALRRVTKTQVAAFECDVSDESQLTDAFAAATEVTGPPRGVVASAGIDRSGELHELPASDWDGLLAVNLRGTFLTCREALRHMIPAAGGSIVCVSSPFAFVAAPGSSAYSASKGGISALVRGLAVDYADRGIRVNALLPGPTDTALMWANVPEAEIPEMRAVIESEVPLGRLARPEEPAQAALWLLSEDASYVTGSQLACDGGVLAKASVSV